MPMTSPKQPHNSFPKRLGYAWEVLKSSLSVHLFGGLSALAVVDHIFKFQDRLVKAGYLDPKLIPVGHVIYVVLAFFFVRAVFLIAEEAGKNRESLIAADSERESHYQVFECIHAVIHQTRDSLLADGAFRNIVKMAEPTHIEELYSIIQSQLGMLEKAMRALTKKDCCVVLKTLAESAPDNCELISSCYGPGTPIERRKKSTRLPLNQGIAYAAYVTKSICHSNDINEDPRFWPLDQKATFSVRYRTVVACPVIVNKQVIAILCFDWREPNMYDEKYSEVLACFTDTISAACYICYETRHVNPKPANENEK